MTLLSACAYVAFSQELRHEIGNLAYPTALLTGFVRDAGIGPVRLLRPVSVRGALVLLAFGASAIGTAVACFAAVMARRPRSGDWVELIAAVAAAVVLPFVLIATVGWPDGQGALAAPLLIGTTLAMGVVAGIAAYHRHRQRAPTRRPSPGDSDRLAAPEGLELTAGGRAVSPVWAWMFALLLLPLLLAIWWNGVDALRGFDTQADHLPRAARWLRLGRISDESGVLLTPFYPGNFLVAVRWMLELGTDAYTFVPSLASSVVCIGCLYVICREMGQGPTTAAVSALSAVSVSLIPYLSTTVQADMGMNACLLVAVVILLRWRRANSSADARTDAGHVGRLLLFGVSLGLAIGVKYSAIPPAIALAGIAFIYIVSVASARTAQRKLVVEPRTVVVSVAWIAAGAFVCGGYWLVRNAIQHGNPVYPVAVAGLPGVDMRVIIPFKPALARSLWHRMTYPWVQWDFGYVYDDGLGAVFPSVATVGFLLAPFVARRGHRTTNLVWVITALAYVTWLSTGSITARFGLFPVMLTFCFVGELWDRFPTIGLKVITAATFALSCAVSTFSLLVGAVYTSSMSGSGRAVPRVVDRLPPARIFNATAASNRYRLLGPDYRHEVITSFSSPTPEDVRRSHARYVLLRPVQEGEFRAALDLHFVERGAGQDSLALWRVGGSGNR